jgi:hypothetical protein
MSSNLPLRYSVNGNFFPAFPGAWLVCNNGASATSDNVSLPVYTSIFNFADANYARLGIDNSIDNIILLPGFKISVFVDPGYSGTGGDTETFTNTDGTNIAIYTLTTTQNLVTSLKLYFREVEIPVPT